MEKIETNVYLSAIFVRFHRLPIPRIILACSKTAAARFLFIGSIHVKNMKCVKLTFKDIMFYACFSCIKASTGKIDLSANSMPTPYCIYA